MTKHLLIFLLLIIAVACRNKNLEYPAPSSTSSIEVKLDYESRDYELGETIKATLTVTEKNAAGNYFVFSADCNGGETSATVNGQSLQWQTEHPMNYEIVNEKFASKVLHLTLTPEAGATAVQHFTFTFHIAAADGTETQNTIHINSINTAEITTQAHYADQPIELEQQLSMTLYAEKERFKGDFSVRLTIAKGNGFLVIDNRNLHTGDRFTLPAGSSCELRYQPLTTGSHLIKFFVSDDICSTEQPVEVEVFNQGGVAKPGNGIYIYTTEGLYFSADRWKDLPNKEDFSTEGVAIISGKNRFLLAPEYSSGYWGNSLYGPGAGSSYTTLLPDVPWVEDKNDAITDFDGRKNTEALVRAYEDGRLHACNAARFCYNYDPGNPGRWYLPAAGQMNLIVEHIDEVQKCLKLIDGQPFVYEYMNYDYATSTGRNNSYLWSLAFSGSGTAALEDVVISQIVKFYPVRDL